MATTHDDPAAAIAAVSRRVGFDAASRTLAMQAFKVVTATSLDINPILTASGTAGHGVRSLLTMSLSRVWCRKT